MIYIAGTGIIVTGCTNGHIYEWSTKKILANMKKYQKGDHDKEKQPKTAPQDQYKLFMINKVCRDQSDLTCM